MNVRVLLRLALLIVIAFGHSSMAEEVSILSRATDAWRQGDSETALTLVEPALTGIDSHHRELHELYQNIEVYHDRREALEQRYQNQLAEAKLPTAYYLLARITSDFGEKERLLQEGLTVAPQDRFLVREWARCLYRQGKWKEAEKALLPALESWPKDLEVHSIYFNTLERQGRLDEGLSKFRKWAVESSNNVFLQVMAYRCLEEDLPEEADEFLNRAVALSPKDPLVLMTLSERAGDRQQQEELNTHLAAWREQEPWGDFLPVSGMVDVVFNRKIPQGLEKFHLYTRLKPLSPVSWARRAHISAMLGQFEQAKRYGERALALQPIFPQTFHTLGIVGVNEKRFDDGIRYFEAALASSRPSAVNLRPLAHCYKEIGEHEKAKACLERAEALRDEASAQSPTASFNRSGELVIEDEKEGRAEGLCQLGRLLAQEGKLNEARVKFLEATDEDPDHALPHWNLALLEQMGFRDLEKAISHWEAARERMSSESSVSRLGFLTRKLALAHYRLGRLKEAIEVLSAFVSEHEVVVGEVEETVRLHERMTGGAENRKSVRLQNVRARHSTEDNYCLPQSLATILDYWRLPNEVSRIGSFIGDDRYLGKALQSLAARADDVSYRCFTPNVARVKALIDAGVPVLLVGQFLPLGADKYMGHATVVVGYDELLEQVLLEDSNWFQGWEMVPYERLHELRAVVIAPPDKLSELKIELPDKDYHEELNRLEPFVLDKAAPASSDELDDMIRQQPNHWYGHFLAGMVARRDDDRYAAVRHLKRAVENSSSVAWPHVFIAEFYADDSVVIEARDWLRKALKREPNLHIARKLLIQLLFDPSRKLEDLEKKLQFLSNGRGIKTNLEEAITESYHYLKHHPDDDEILMNLLVCELKLGRFKNGEQTARKLIKQTNHVQMHFWLAISLEKQGKFDEAIAAATTGTRLAPDEETKRMFAGMIDSFSKAKADSEGN